MRRAQVDTENWLRHAWLNRLQSALLLLVMGGLLALVGWLLWGGAGIVSLLIAGVVIVLMNPAFAPQWIMRMYGAKLLTPGEAPGLYAAVRELAGRAGLEVMPRIHYIPSRMVNAFTVGRTDQSAIAVTDALLRVLDSREIVAVLAHEISHIRSNDIWVMSLADMFSRLTSLLSTFGLLLLLVSLPLAMMSQVSISWFAILLLIVAPNLSALAQLGLSRTREYDADLNAARLTGDPEGMARALIRIEQVSGAWLERIFLPGRGIPDPSLLRTHPSTESRIQRLRELIPHARHSPIPGWSSDVQSAAPPATRAPRWHINGLWY
ncbi:MAG: zinc metalloprotease HtpX [Gammaproteobacteria bacterium]|nr:zinc metalloprotease HtpX [Gammaproteobacteria bacterium]